jgi:hypothetical protein
MYSLDRISKQQWNNASSQGARMRRNWNNRGGNWLVACYGTLWCQLADTQFTCTGCTSAVRWCLLCYPSRHGTNPYRWRWCKTKSNIPTALSAGNMTTARLGIILFVHVNDCKLLVPTNTHILKYYNLSGCYLFRPVAITNLTTKYLKTHSNKLVLTMLSVWM